VSDIEPQARRRSAYCLLPRHTGHRAKKWGCTAAQLRAAFEATGSIMADSAPNGQTVRTAGERDRHAQSEGFPVCRACRSNLPNIVLCRIAANSGSIVAAAAQVGAGYSASGLPFSSRCRLS